jgi:hypothetical protein
VDIPFTVVIDAENPVAKIDIQERQVLLKPGEWSEWVPVSFEMLPFGAASAHGIVRFYLKEIRPDLKLYASPVNVDPSNPILPISEPAVAAVARQLRQLFNARNSGGYEGPFRRNTGQERVPGPVPVAARGGTPPA